jgi:hypothetical protein
MGKINRKRIKKRGSGPPAMLGPAETAQGHGQPPTPPTLSSSLAHQSPHVDVPAAPRQKTSHRRTQVDVPAAPRTVPHSPRCAQPRRQAPKVAAALLADVDHHRLLYFVAPLTVPALHPARFSLRHSAAPGPWLSPRHGWEGRRVPLRRALGGAGGFCIPALGGTSAAPPTMNRTWTPWTEEGLRLSLGIPGLSWFLPVYQTSLSDTVLFGLVWFTPFRNEMICRMQFSHIAMDP